MMIEIQDIFRDNIDGYKRNHALSLGQLKAMGAKSQLPPTFALHCHRRWSARRQTLDIFKKEIFPASQSVVTQVSW